MCILDIVRKELQLSAQLDLKGGSAIECTDQNVVLKKWNKSAVLWT